MATATTTKKPSAKEAAAKNRELIAETRRQNAAKGRAVKAENDAKRKAEAEAAQKQQAEAKAPEKPKAPEKTPQDEKRENSAMKIVSALGKLTQAQKKEREEDEEPVLNELSALAILTPDKLHDLAFISTYNSKDPQSTSRQQNGYQREPMNERFPAIGRYYAREGAAHLIPPLIVSVRVYTPEDQKRFNELFNEGNIGAIHREFTRAAFSIIDGQHRAGGLYWAWNNIDDFNAEVPVMMFYGLRYEEEAQLFDDINTTQRKVAKALVEATAVHMYKGQGGHSQNIREIAFSVAQDGDSPWYGSVSMTGQTSPETPVSYEGLRRATAGMLPERLLDRVKLRGLDPDEVVKRYWTSVSKACGQAWNNQPRIVTNEDGSHTEIPVKYRLRDLAGVAAVSQLGRDILSTALDRTTTDEDFWETVTDYVSRLSPVDWEKRADNPWMQQGGAGFAGAKVLYNTLYNLVYLDTMPGVSNAA